jgi:hypothetical protein
LAWRNWPSGVQPAKLTSATSVGFTQRSGTPVRRVQRPFFAGAAKAEVLVSSLVNRVFKAAAVCAFQPVPTLPTETSVPSSSCTPSIRLPISGAPGSPVRSVKPAITNS